MPSGGSERPEQGRVTERLELAGLCRLLAQLFRSELGQDLAQGLSASGALRALEERGYPFGAETVTDVQHLRALRCDFTSLFIGPGPHLSPYGSVHHPDDPRRGQLWGETTKQVRRFALDHGLSFTGARYDGIPDHIGHELELYARLLVAEAEALSRGETAVAERLVNSQRALLEQHLARWVPDFCREVQARARSPFYAATARCAADLLSSETERLSA